MRGLGHDVVEVTAFAQQLEQPGTTMGKLFSMRERRQAQQSAQRHGDGIAVHLAGKWAAKESVIKAWCEALAQQGVHTRAALPYTIESVPWSRIEILDDALGVPHVVLGSEVQAMLVQSLGDAGTAEINQNSPKQVRWHVSISHDGPIASAVTVLD
ncbi:holo-ACP synthase [Bifidobacterium gallicum]|uniref:ACP synthase n=1 Tax=Bifidobacterium gallicum DSM 20093 = LMG 11596 TaxID=561180 RepID=D1NVL4_9BIFI|nr:holo-ACP synthase [Bifidobacterium gallicum]EFA22865.1 phosphopantetheine--protein transferase domain protein [Bifidobacterium gallicum DSM 20093 = LMG 11596]KFI59427.1 ACP synthase [Bifidobacterium gallicum DSM 20093 = LMG 11596]